MKEIKLTQGKVALVDDHLFEELNKFKWYAHKAGNTFYAHRKIRLEGVRKTLKMHRCILDLTNINIVVDHINHNGLDNQLSNIRACTNKENHRNQRIRTGGTSKFKGVCMPKKYKNWQASIKCNGVYICIGQFRCEIEAAKAYDKAALHYFGEFANLNFK